MSTEVKVYKRGFLRLKKFEKFSITNVEIYEIYQNFDQFVYNFTLCVILANFAMFQNFLGKSFESVQNPLIFCDKSDGVVLTSFDQTAWVQPRVLVLKSRDQSSSDCEALSGSYQAYSRAPASKRNYPAFHLQRTPII